MEKEYIVTLKNFDDLDNFYTEMEASSGSGSVPTRACKCCCRRTISRNTNYELTEAEATELAKDSRVLAVEEPPAARGIVPRETGWTQSGNWDKSPDAASDKNWALKRLIDAAQTSGWGSDGTAQETGSVSTTSSGKNVDVIIVDQHIEFNHPEFRTNSDGTGEQRSIPFNWFQYSGVLGHSTNATYSYATISNSHGTHVAGTVAGVTQGWARSANIYNMAYTDSLSGVSSWTELMWDYIRHFHKNKPINPETGKRNPTITNHSWGYTYTGNANLYNPNDSFNFTNIGDVVYRGATTDLSSVSGNSAKKDHLVDRGIPVISDYVIYAVPARVDAVDADIADAIEDGVIVVSAAGNSYFPVDVPSGDDYDNSFENSSVVKYTGRGSTPAAATDVICVGSIGTKSAEYKAPYSNFNKRIDIWAPGTNIMSAVANSSSGYSNQQQDPNNSSYYIASASGTSMASPQITGLLACVAEQWPRIRQADARAICTDNRKDQIGDEGTDPATATPWESLGDSNNRYAYYEYERPQSGTVWPHENYKPRYVGINSGTKYPRVNSCVTKSLDKGITATGGTKLVEGQYTFHVYTDVRAGIASTSFNVVSGSGNVEYLLVGGGGGGAGRDPTARMSAGGGAGGLRTNMPGVTDFTGNPLTGAAFPVTPGNYVVYVGKGGNGGQSSGPPLRGVSGTATTFSSLTAAGGGGGGGGSGNADGFDGGSGGGSSSVAPGVYSVGDGNSPPVSPPQGFPGGLGANGPTSGAGGGGGAGTAGATGSGLVGGNGGRGVTVPQCPASIMVPSLLQQNTPSPSAHIPLTQIYNFQNAIGIGTYAGGGGGCSPDVQGVGGTGGGGQATPGSLSQTQYPGIHNTGGGGGASGSSSQQAGGYGGNGIVVIRYLT